MINLDGQKNLPNNEEEKPTLVGLFNTIFTSPLSSDEKIKRLEDVYNIPRTEKIKEGVAKMCNLSSGFLEIGREEGESKMSQLVTLLLKDIKLDVLEKASKDEKYRKQLFEEYGL